MALDIGDRRIGVAISDPLQVVARPLLVVERRGRAPDLERIAGLVREWNARSVIVGWPLMPSGDRGDQARTVEAFVRRLRRTLSVPIQLWDESYTTREAEARLRGRGIGWRAAKSVVDAEAAAVILEEWMREHGGIDERRTPDTAKGDSLGST